jgi:hypothetical protein
MSATRLYVTLALISMVFSCSTPEDYYLSTPEAGQEQLGELFSLLANTGDSEEERFAVTQKIAATLLDREDFSRLITFLTGEVEALPDSPYNARHLLTVAWAYSKEKADSIAALYYDRILKNYPDLTVNGESIHYACIRRLIALSSEVERRIELRRELIARFPDQIDMGAELFLLAADYEAVGDWDSALDSYRRFMPYYGSEIPGRPDALQHARTFIDLATIPKDWTYETLDALLEAIKVAMSTGNARSLSRMRAKVGFFAMDWHQHREDGNSQVLFDFSAFMARSRIQFSPDLDPASNSREAFLRTWGWTERIAIWYLYFRKIDFPADPEVHGRWEWAGIYFGEKMQ